jgi:hypothetical protein
LSCIFFLSSYLIYHLLCLFVLTSFLIVLYQAYSSCPYANLSVYIPNCSSLMFFVKFSCQFVRS